MPASYQTVFIGGGLSCLAAARALRGDSLLLEKEDRVGGLCRSDARDGFVFDRTGHLLHLRTARVRRLVRRLLKGNLEERVRNSWIYSHGVYTRYPFQSHFHGLPPEVAAECLLGIIQASNPKRDRKPGNFEDWVLTTFGPGVGRHFMFPYNRKLWTVAPGQLTTEWMGRFVPRPDLLQVIRGALQDLHDEAGYNARFLYPRSGGIESLVRALASGVPRVACGAEVKRVLMRSRTLVLATGDRVGFGRLVTCMPLPVLIRRMDKLPDRVRKAASRLRWASVFNLNLGIRDPGSDRHWVYVPEDRFALYRFGFASNFSARMAPPGAANVYTEVAHNPRRPPRPAEVRKRVIRDLIRIGVIRSAKDIRAEQVHQLPFAYAIYDKERTRAVGTILRYLESRGVHCIGRYGRWEYGSMEDALRQGLELADRLR